MLSVQPISYREAIAFIRKHHRHHRPPQGFIVAIAVNDGDKVVGVATLARPVARGLQDGWTAEVTRLCTDGTPHAASKLYGRIRRVAQQLGYRRVITYILASEPGVSLIAAGWKPRGLTGGGTWNRPNIGRPRVDTHPIEQKQLWETAA
jgi:hypothetical protein